MINPSKIYGKIKELAKDSLEQYLDSEGNTMVYHNTPKFSDLEVFSLAITAKCLQIHSECLLWSKIKKVIGTSPRPMSPHKV